MARVRIPSLALCLASAGCLQYTNYSDTETTTDGPTSTTGLTTTPDPTPGTVTLDTTTTTTTTTTVDPPDTATTVPVDPTTNEASTTTGPIPECGNGEVESGEECDDGEDENGSYGKCAEDCKGPGPRCGDGTLQNAELCDDGDAEDKNACSNTCVPARLVFVTSKVYQGDFGGLLAADKECGDLATSKNLGQAGTLWIAWLSDDTTNAGDRVDAEFTGWFILPNGDPVAQGKSGLTSGTLENPINEFESGIAVPPNEVQEVWTNTNPDGNRASDTNDCDGWKSKSSMKESTYGELQSTAEQWTNSSPESCNNSFRLYCLQNSTP